MEYYQLSASAFADRIQVPRSSISHLLSGRNKPSLDFVLKVVKEFSEVELYWLLNGKGSFPHTSHLSVEEKEIIDKKTGSIKEDKVLENPTIPDQNEKLLEKIVFFYSDGSFKEYHK